MCYAVLVVCLRAGHASGFVGFLKVMVTGSGEGDVGRSRVETSGGGGWVCGHERCSSFRKN
jgi:hypothetical protein